MGYSKYEFAQSFCANMCVGLNICPSRKADVLKKPPGKGRGQLTPSFKSEIRCSLIDIYQPLADLLFLRFFSDQTGCSAANGWADT